VTEGAELVGSAVGLHLEPQELADALNIVVWTLRMEPRLWAAWSPSTRALAIRRDLPETSREYALVLGAAHVIRAQLVEPQDLYLYGPQFQPLYRSDLFHGIKALVDAYFYARPSRSLMRVASA
jgi:hypothetical protein